MCGSASLWSSTTCTDKGASSLITERLPEEPEMYDICALFRNRAGLKLQGLGWVGLIFGGRGYEECLIKAQFGTVQARECQSLYLYI